MLNQNRSPALALVNENLILSFPKKMEFSNRDCDIVHCLNWFMIFLPTYLSTKGEIRWWLCRKSFEVSSLPIHHYFSDCLSVTCNYYNNSKYCNGWLIVRHRIANLCSVATSFSWPFLSYFLLGEMEVISPSILVFTPLLYLLYQGHPFLSFDIVYCATC